MEEGKDVTKADESKTNSKKEDPNSDLHLPKIDQNQSKSDDGTDRFKDMDINDYSINNDLSADLEGEVNSGKKKNEKKEKKPEIDMLGLNNKTLVFVYSEDYKGLDYELAVKKVNEPKSYSYDLLMGFFIAVHLEK